MVRNGQPNSFYLLGFVWVHLDPPPPFQTKIEFLSRKHKGRLRWGALQQKIIPKVRTEMFWIEVFDFLPEHLIELHEKENIWSLAWWKDPACSRRPTSFHQIHFSTSLMTALMTIHSFKIFIRQQKYIVCKSLLGGVYITIYISSQFRVYGF